MNLRGNALYCTARRLIPRPAVLCSLSERSLKPERVLSARFSR
jgi:hypothetical protein